MRLGRTDLVLSAVVAYWLAYAAWLVAAAIGYPLGDDRQRALISETATLPISFASAAFAWHTASTRAALAWARPWRAIALALLVYSFGSTLWFAYDAAGLTPFPSPATLCYLAFYLLTLWGLLSVPLAPRTGIERARLWLDIATVAIAGCMVVWHFVVHPLAIANAQDSLQLGLTVLSPVMDMVLLVGVLTVVLRGVDHVQQVSLRPLALGLVVFGVADLLFGYANLKGAYRPGDLVDGLWPLAQLLIVISAVRARRQMQSLSSAWVPDGEQPNRYTWLPYLAVACAYGLLVTMAIHPDDPDLPQLIGGAVVLTALVVARQALAQRENGRLLAVAATRRSEARFRALVQHASDVITVLAPDGQVLYQSPSVERVFGHAAAAMPTLDFARLTTPDDYRRVRAFLDEAGRQPRVSMFFEWQMRHADGSWRDVEGVATNLVDEPDVVGIVLTMRDITERKSLEEQLAHQAFHDALTGLPNRALFQDRLTHALQSAVRRGTRVGVLYVDLDNFKTVNDSLGHAVGDQLLVALAQRVIGCVRPSDTAARFGGDEFALLLEDVDDVSGAVHVANRLLSSLQAPFDVEGRQLFVKTSIGIALSRERNVEGHDLVRDADLALYAAKGQGKGRYVVFEPTMEVRATERLEIETDMRRGLAQDEFRVFYQPIVDMQTRAVVELEALVRWAHPVRGLVSPLVFISIAEETGLIIPLGTWVLRQACQLGARLDGVTVSVNLSPRQFQQPDLVGTVRHALLDSGLEPRRLKLEITESLAMQDADATARTLGELRTLGTKLAIDDFGTGYSSLSYLKQFPLDTLKIDRSFVTGLGRDTQDSAIVRSIIALARSLDLGTTAEGVETETQYEHLQALGCDLGQGYLFGHPAPPEDLFGNAARAA
jgi:diguanylate cyclase (GGDEF)-like protein/PAS domain S-box-containing protein